MNDLLRVAVDAPRRAVAVESIEKGQGKPFHHRCNLANEGQARRPEDVSIEAELHNDVSARTHVNYK